MNYSPDSPAGLGSLSQKVLDVLAHHSWFPWATLATQCKPLGIDPKDLTPSDLDRLIEPVIAALERWAGEEQNYEGMKQQLLKLRQEWNEGP